MVTDNGGAAFARFSLAQACDKMPLIVRRVGRGVGGDGPEAAAQRFICLTKNAGPSAGSPSPRVP